LCLRSVGQSHALARTLEHLEPVPRASLVLTEFNLQYRILFARPDLALVPSSELGFPHPSIRDAYIAYVKQGRVCALADRIGARFLVDAPSHRLDPSDRACLAPVREDSELRVWRVVLAPNAGPEA
jgi:hypothetical protein